MARSVNKVEDVILPLAGILHLHRVALDGDALFALQIHVVQHLVLELPVAHRTGHLKHPVSQSTLSVVNMRYYAKISYMVHSVVFSL